MAVFQGCPGSQTMDFSHKKGPEQGEAAGKIESELKQWPVQMHLISPNASYYKNADVLLTADCVAYALGDYHRQYLKGKALAIACPKLDEEQEIYVEKIRAWIDEAKINTLTIMIMQVPCCGGLLALAQEAAKTAKRKVPIKYLVVGIQGDILQEEWV
jgi:hypothetical protein